MLYFHSCSETFHQENGDAQVHIFKFFNGGGMHIFNSLMEEEENVLFNLDRPLYIEIEEADYAYILHNIHLSGVEIFIISVKL